MRYLSPCTLDDAFNLLATHDLTVVAGGTDFFPSRQRHELHTDILDVTRIASLSGITFADNRWKVGAATSWTDIVRADLPAAFRGLQMAAREVGSLQIQNSGTIAGNLCNASPAADGVPPLLTLEASVELGSTRGFREVPLSEFITGVRQTARTNDEIVTAVYLPNPPTGAVGHFEKLGARRYLVISITMTSAVIGLDENRRINYARIAVGAASAVAQRLESLEADLIGKTPEAVEITPDHLAPLSPIDDVRGDAAYRLDAVAEQCVRAIREAGKSHG
ncbi:xanthine dehydrogenase family protein subunit M [Ruegeria sp. Ofav3-42]|uniref:FAD binding domain-containing protein n=1 Tax=Ruegeria sp. Ofav3-42 TaxID=2917759 RepID=UPI001EF73627|nr:FAD binding domain-containing protein [Ruegeria sp. Ofav3-42]MCG7519932.1 FAD binding domain-containing protein [Ruegeria sp. Ofav3-42]